jgi:hypothetical protein
MSKTNLLSYFAKPVENIPNLECESILFLKNTIYNEINEKDTVRLFRKENGEETDIDDKNSFINKNFILYNRFDKKKQLCQSI